MMIDTGSLSLVDSNLSWEREGDFSKRWEFKTAFWFCFLNENQSSEVAWIPRPLYKLECDQSHLIFCTLTHNADLKRIIPRLYHKTSNTRRNWGQRKRMNPIVHTRTHTHTKIICRNRKGVWRGWDKVDRPRQGCISVAWVVHHELVKYRSPKSMKIGGVSPTCV